MNCPIGHADHAVAVRPMRRIVHPGLASIGMQPAEAVATRLTPLRLDLPAGGTLLDAVGTALSEADAASAVAALGPGALFPFASVMPARSLSPEHAVWYSDRIDAAAPVRLDTARITFGLRDGRPWLHAHARWTEADGTTRGGHLLPDRVRLAEPLRLDAWRLDDAVFDVRPDGLTRFSLFRPVAVDSAADAMDAMDAADSADAPARSDTAIAVRLPPNLDACTALEALCRERGITRAVVRGGVGSTVGAVFDDGRVVEPFVTELLVREGRVRPDAAGEPVAELDVTLVDHTGALSEGRLARGANAVLVTFELVIEPA